MAKSVKNPQQLLQRLLEEKSESTWLEFKQNNCRPDEIGETVCALANAAMLEDRDRAFIVFGVEDKTKKLVGTSVVLSDLQKGSENFANWLSRKLSPRIQLEFIDFEHRGSNFSIIAIEPSYDRPVRFGDTEFLRVGSNVKKLAEFPNHERSLWTATNRRRFEHSIALPNQTFENVTTLLDIETFYRLSKLPPTQEEAEVTRKLCSEGLLHDDMEGGFHISNLGAILIARDLKQFPTIKNKSVRIVGYRDTTKKESVFEQEGQKGYAAGFEGMMRFIMQRMPSDERYIDGVRQIVPRLPEVAIREVIANALIHQDFTISGSAPIIEIYSDRMEVSNPGNSLIEIDRMIDERRSRNETLASILRNLGLCEERGGGLDKALIAIEENHLPGLSVRSSEQSMRVIIYGPKPFSELSKAEKQNACFYHCVLRWISHDYMSNTTLRDRFSLPQEEYQTASTIISDSIKARRIKPAELNQGKRNAKYVPYWA